MQRRAPAVIRENLGATVEQSADDVGKFRPNGEVQEGRTFRPATVQVRLPVKQDIDDLFVASEDREFERGVAGFVRRVNQCGGREQPPDQVRVAEARGIMEREASLVGRDFEPRSAFEKGVHLRTASAQRGEVERRASVMIAELRIGPQGQQFRGARRVLPARGKMEQRSRREARAGDLGTQLEQGLDDGVVAPHEGKFEDAERTGLGLEGAPGRFPRLADEPALPRLHHAQQGRAGVGVVRAGIQPRFAEQFRERFKSFGQRPDEGGASVGVAQRRELPGMLTQPRLHTVDVLQADEREQVGFFTSRDERPVSGRFQAATVRHPQAGRTAKDQRLQGGQLRGVVRFGGCERQDRVRAVMIPRDLEQAAALRRAHVARAGVGQEQGEELLEAGLRDQIEGSLGVGAPIGDREQVCASVAEQSNRLGPSDGIEARSRALRNDFRSKVCGLERMVQWRAIAAGPRIWVCTCCQQAAHDLRVPALRGDMQRGLPISHRPNRPGPRPDCIDLGLGFEQQFQRGQVAPFRGKLQPASVDGIPTRCQCRLCREHAFQRHHIPAGKRVSPLREVLGGGGRRSRCLRRGDGGQRGKDREVHGAMEDAAAHRWWMRGTFRSVVGACKTFWRRFAAITMMGVRAAAERGGGAGRRAGAS